MSVKLYCIVGMHRSGTSVVSRALSLLGAHLGPADDLMPPKPDNPSGFWESRRVTALHDDLLAALGGRWDAPAFSEDGWQDRAVLDPFRGRIAEVVGSHFAGAQVAYWKDPRGSLLMPLWREVADVSGTILVLRDPADVAASLARRDGLGCERAAWLWLRYMSAAVRHDRDHLLVSYADLFVRPSWVAARLAAFCDLPAPTEDTLHAIGAFIDPNLRHTGPSGAEGPMLMLARAFFRVLAREERDVAVPFANLVHDRFRTLAELEFFRDRATRLLTELVPPVTDR